MTHLPPGNSTIVNTRHQAIPGATVAPDAGAIVVTFSTVRPSSPVFTVCRRIANAVAIVLAAMTVVAVIGFVWSVVHAGHPKVAGKGEAIEAPAPISPLRGDRLEMLTIDHIAGPGQRQILIRAVGAEQDVRIDHLAFQAEPFDRYLLCTDGVHGGLRDSVLREFLGRRAGAEETACEIVDRAVARSVGDNATALIVDIVKLPAATYAEFETALTQSKILAVPSEGALIDGFRLDAVLNDGRYTRVFDATDTIEARRVVLKFPKPHVGADGPMREAFLRETWIASRVQSQFVGEVLQLSADHQTQLYLVLPFYEGETLKIRLQRSPELSLTAGLDIAQKLTRAVAAVHRAGVIHRDIKPDNVILQPPAQRQGTSVKLVDFGVARLKQSTKNEESPEPGTPSYMAPELFAGMSADETSDQFAPGVTVYRMFTRQYPYGEIEPFTHPKLRGATPIVSHRPDLPAWLGRAVGRAIAVNPKDRYEDVLEFMFELEHGADRASPIQVQRMPLYERNPLLFWKVVSGLLVLLLAVAIIFLVRSRQHPVPARETSRFHSSFGQNTPLPAAEKSVKKHMDHAIADSEIRWSVERSVQGGRPC